MEYTEYIDKSGNRYSVDKLHKICENLPVHTLDISTLDLSNKIWNNRSLSIDDFIKNPTEYPDHLARTQKADLKFPIIVYEGEIVDGNHRLTKVILDGGTVVKANVLTKGVMARSRIIGSLSTRDEVIKVVTGDITASVILAFGKAMVPNPNGGFRVVEPPFNYKTKIMIKKGELPNVKEDTMTTVGRVIANKLLLVDPFGSSYPYDNGVMNINGLINRVTADILDGTITTSQFSKLQNNAAWLTRFADMLIPSLSKGVMTMPKKARILRDKLVKENPNPTPEEFINKVEKPVLAVISDELKNDPSMMIYSRKKPSVGNQLKQCIGTFSPIYSPFENKLKTVNGNLEDGYDPKDYYLFATDNIDGTYSRAVATQVGGALVKTVYNACSVMTCTTDKPSDCGTKRLLPVVITDKNVHTHHYQYFVEDGNTKLFSPSIANNYIGTIVSFRSVMFCNHGKFTVCSTCSGDFPYRSGMLSIGNLTTKAFFQLVQAALKSFHDTTVNFLKIDPFKYMM